ncbi:transporter substrate-binding domain-containing protein [Nostoc sp. UHCC 0252]|uniref:transporter substrate-binding domain-containing protein n=1 Tax=Nostoc sp. UHCC 0252 TaxID=3110241 RepID=UPI002B2057BC|nr:transporter substrate-binding domain-containing protein [Nostoc sp. UHCC 0252]MEA5603041.1 transporter substrate-binding domain-containing protein [Nostoc sp. UHCC 0252]
MEDSKASELLPIYSPKDSPHLDAINKAIGALLSNGTYKQIYQKWFAAEPPQLPHS